jgi:adenylate kinase family enzyme
VQRSDDTAEAAKARIEQQRKLISRTLAFMPSITVSCATNMEICMSIVPVLAFYQLSNVPIAQINGDQSPDLVFKEIVNALGAPAVPVTEDTIRTIAAKTKGAN